MRLLRIAGVLVCLLVVVSFASAGTNMGIRDVGRVTFAAPIRVGTALLPAGDYIVRHTMEGQDHIMVFEPVKGKLPAVKVKCTLVPLAQKAPHDGTLYTINAANEHVLQELVFRGDKAKHVF